MSARRLLLLIKHMPSDSHVARAIHGEVASWDLNSYLLTKISNTLVAANAQRGGKRPSPNDMLKPPSTAPELPARSKRRKRVTPPPPKEQPGTWKDLDALFNAD